VDTKQALYNTMKGKEQAKNDAANPLVNGNGKLIPSVTRVFRSDRDLEVLLQAYQGTPNATNTSSPQPAAEKSSNAAVIAFVSFYQNGQRIMQSQPVQAAALAENRLGVIPISMKVPLEGLKAGEYQCQVTVLDPEGNRAAFWQGSVAIVTTNDSPRISN
jgi:hypothetical protein